MNITYYYSHILPLLRFCRADVPENRRYWTNEEENVIRKLIEVGRQPHEMRSHLPGRTLPAIKLKLARMRKAKA